MPTTPTLIVVALIGVAVGLLIGRARWGRADSVTKAPPAIAEQLAESERRVNDFAEAASDWFWEMDPDLRFTYFSPRSVEVTGVPIDFHIGKTRQELAGEDATTEKWQQHFDDLEARRPFRDFRFMRRGHDGRLQHLSTSGKPIFAADGRFQGYRGIGTDITAEVEAEERAALANQRLAEAIEGLSELFVLWGPDDRLVVCNQRFREINAAAPASTQPGTSFTEHVDMVMALGLYMDAKGREDAWRQERLARHASPTEPFEQARQDGRWLLINEQRLPDGSTVTISMDITQVKRHEAQLIDARDEAERANRAKSQFLANMSHELRTPLNAILGFSDIIRNQSVGPLSDESYVAYGADIHESGQHLLNLISDLLDLSRIEAGAHQLTESDIGLSDLLGALSPVFAQMAAEHEVDLAVDQPAAGLVVKADERAMRQMLLNLMSNAVKFTRAGGRVDLNVTDTEDGLAIIIIDNGIGIAQAHMATVLSPFGQVASGLAGRGGGTGLGLPIVKTLIEAHGGSLKLDSAVDSGTTVKLLFPAERVASRAVS